MQVNKKSVFSNGAYPLLVASLGLGTVTLFNVGPLHIRVWEIFLILFLAIMILRFGTGKADICTNSIAILFIQLLILCVVLSGFNAFSLERWAKQSSLLLAMLVLFGIVSHRWLREQLLQNIRWVIYPCTFIAFWGVLEVFLFPAELPVYSVGDITMPRARSLFAEPNEFSQFLALPFAFLFSAVLYYRKVSSWERWCFTVGLFIIILAQLLSFSRGGLVVFVAEILAWLLLRQYVYMRDLHSFRVNKFLLYILLSVIGFLLLDLQILNIIDIFIDRIQTLFSGDDITSKIRWEGIISATSETINLPANLVIGMGFGNLALFFGGGVVSEVATTSNIVIDIFSELGSIGLISFISFVVLALILPIGTLKKLSQKKDDEMIVIFFGAYLSFFGLLIGGLTYATHLINIFWFSCGLLFAISKYKHIDDVGDK